MRLLFKITIFSFLLAVLFGPVFADVALATADPLLTPINTNLPIPEDVAVPISGQGGRGPAAVVANFYTLAFIAAGFLAFGSIIYASLLYAFSGGSSSRKTEAKETLKGTGYGLGLLMVAYLILRIINPDLTNLQLAGLEPYRRPTSTGATASGDDPNCLISPLSPLPADALAFENGQTVTFFTTGPVLPNLTQLKDQVDKAQDLFRSGQPRQGIKMTVNSAYRPLSYQNHFYEIFTKNMSLQDSATAALCPNLKAKIEAEIMKHGLQGAVARPSACAPHVKGIAVDLSFEGIGYAEANDFFAANGVDLVWKALPNDRPHYEMSNVRYTPPGC